MAKIVLELNAKTMPAMASITIDDRLNILMPPDEFKQLIGQMLLLDAEMDIHNRTVNNLRVLLKED